MPPGIVFRGHRLDARTARMIEAAEKLGGPLSLTQGAYNGGGVEASGGTHDGGGVSDFSVKGLTRKQINRRVRALRRVGFAAWHRTPDEGPWAAHIHAVAVGCKDLSPVAARQVTALRRGRNGLRSDRLDRHRGMNLPVITWETYQQQESDDVTKDDISAIAKAVLDEPVIWNRSAPKGEAGSQWSVSKVLSITEERVETLQAEIRDVNAKLDQVLAALNRP